MVDLGADIASPTGKQFHDPAFSPLLQRLTERGEEDLLQSILEKLPPANLLQAARVRTCLIFFFIGLIHCLGKIMLFDINPSGNRIWGQYGFAIEF